MVTYNVILWFLDSDLQECKPWVQSFFNRDASIDYYKKLKNFVNESGIDARITIDVSCLKTAQFNLERFRETFMA